MALAVIGRFLIALLFCATVQAQELLPPALAFRATAAAADGQTIEVRFEIADGYYLYRDKIRFSAEPSDIRLGSPELPPGQDKDDENFGRVTVYYDKAVLRLPVQRGAAGRLPLSLTIISQGCAEAGVCYPPQTQQVDLELPAVSAAADVAPVGQRRAVPDNDESGRIARWLKNASLWMVVSAFFGSGVLLSLTPCIFPMIPILLGIIVGSGRREQPMPRRRVFLLALGYVMGMSAAYAVLGVVAGLTGTLLSASLQTPWARGAFALVFVVLALSAFEVFEIQMPAFIQNLIADQERRIKGGTFLALVLMGGLSVLIVSPCMAGPLAGALLYIGQTGDAFLGAGAMFFFGLGTGVPLLIAGTSAGALLPKSGPWMEAVRKAFGVVLLALAVWVVSPLIPVSVQLFAWAALLIVPAIFLHAIDPLPAHAKGAAYFWKGVGLLMLLVGAAMLTGALSGASDPLRPLSALSLGSSTPSAKALPFTRVASLDDLEKRLKGSATPVLLDFRADWCVTCQQMEEKTFADARVREELADWTLLQADVTANTDDDRALLSRFGLFGPPGIIFFDRDGREVRGVRVIGFQNADDFLRTLESVRP